MAKVRIDWQSVAAYRAAGHTIAQCGREFGFHTDAWYKAIDRGLVPKPEPTALRGQRVRYDWSAVQRYYDDGHTYRECRERFGFHAQSWAAAVRAGRLVANGRKWPLTRILEQSRYRSVIKRRLLEAGVLENRCNKCGISEWMGQSISIQIDHRNGIPDDHRVENLRMLCPNCHSQTETYGGRNARKNRRERSSS
jgi:5-methylcytosine-specific restriction endonuclease McrA